MNNYLYANLATGKISKGISGGGQAGNLPTFIIGEENNFNLYFLDFPKPATYPSPALGDNFFYEPKTQVINTDITIRVGTKIGEYIINETIAANNNNLNRSVTGLYSYSFLSTFDRTSIVGIGADPSFLFIHSGVATLSISGTISTPGPTPVEGSVSLGGIGVLPYFYSGYELQQLLQLYGDGLSRQYYSPLPDGGATGVGPTYSASSITALPLIQGIVSIGQTGDYSYSFSYTNLFPTQITTGDVTPPSSISPPPNSNGSFSLLGPAGKYGALNFNSPDWSAVIGSNEETTIWIEIVTSNQVVAQGSAILRKRLTS